MNWHLTDICYTLISDASAQIQNKQRRNSSGTLSFHYHDQEQNITSEGHPETRLGKCLEDPTQPNSFKAGVPYCKQYIKGNFLKPFLERNFCHSSRHFPDIFIFVLSIFDSVGRKSDSLWILLLPFNSTDNSCGNIHIRITS